MNDPPKSPRVPALAKVGGILWIASGVWAAGLFAPFLLFVGGLESTVNWLGVFFFVIIPGAVALCLGIQIIRGALRDPLMLGLGSLVLAQLLFVRDPMPHGEPIFQLSGIALFLAGILAVVARPAYLKYRQQRMEDSHAEAETNSNAGRKSMRSDAAQVGRSEDHRRTDGPC